MSSQSRVFVVGRMTAYQDELVSLVRSNHLTEYRCKTVGDYRRADAPSISGCLVLDSDTSDRDAILNEYHGDGELPRPVIYLADEFDIAIIARLHRSGVRILRKHPYDGHELLAAVHDCIAVDMEARAAAADREEWRRRKASLSEVESRVLEMLLDGRRNREISLAHGVSLSTTVARRARLMRKFGAANFVELLRRFYESTSN